MMLRFNWWGYEMSSHLESRWILLRSWSILTHLNRCRNAEGSDQRITDDVWLIVEACMLKIGSSYCRLFHSAQLIWLALGYLQIETIRLWLLFFLRRMTSRLLLFSWCMSHLWARRNWTTRTKANILLLSFWSLTYVLLHVSSWLFERGRCQFFVFVIIHDIGRLIKIINNYSHNMIILRLLIC